MATNSCSEAGWRILDWDSEFFGFRIARVFEELSGGRVSSIVAECASRGVRCLYFLAEAGDLDTIGAVEQEGFRFTDVRLTLIHQLSNLRQASDTSSIRCARAEDVPALERIAGVSHHDTRFYADSNFPRGRCDDLYGTWVSKSCTGALADTVFVADIDSGGPSGYVTCAMIRPDRGQIGLLAVAPEARGCGIGGRLIHQALVWAKSKGAANVITVTQGRNISAVRAYERCGFVAERMQLWYHRWFDRAGID
jgi:dTDP-4-amino-4,6-dideoxy-D-galactose acyltransferase